MNKVGVHVSTPLVRRSVSRSSLRARAAAETATLLALCGWDTATDGNLGKSPVSGRTRSGICHRVSVCVKTRCATWNFARRVPRPRRHPEALRRLCLSPTTRRFSESRHLESGKTSGDCDGGAADGSDGRVVRYWYGLFLLGWWRVAIRGSCGLTLGGIESPLMGLGFSIAGGASPSNAPSPSPFGATGSPSPAPAFGAGAQRSSPFSVPASSASNEKETTIAAPGESPSQRMTRSRAASKVEKTPPPKFSLTGDGGGAASVSGNTPSSTGKRKRSDGEHVDPSRKELKRRRRRRDPNAPLSTRSTNFIR